MKNYITYSLCLLVTVIGGIIAFLGSVADTSPGEQFRMAALGLWIACYGVIGCGLSIARLHFEIGSAKWWRYVVCLLLVSNVCVTVALLVAPVAIGLSGIEICFIGCLIAALCLVLGLTID
jgi:hypothetical protein